MKIEDRETLIQLFRSCPTVENAIKEFMIAMSYHPQTNERTLWDITTEGRGLLHSPKVVSQTVVAHLKFSVIQNYPEE